MQEKLISLECALLAKEKGFNSESDKCYVEKEAEFNVVYNRDGDTADFPCKPPHLKTTKYLDYPEIILAYAPTQALIQKWLRENYNLIVEPIGSGIDKTYSIKIFYLGEISTKKSIGYTNAGNTYEEALEGGLIEALKLI